MKERHRRAAIRNDDQRRGRHGLKSERRDLLSTSGSGRRRIQPQGVGTFASLLGSSARDLISARPGCWCEKISPFLIIHEIGNTSPWLLASLWSSLLFVFKPQACPGASVDKPLACYPNETLDLLLA